MNASRSSATTTRNGNCRLVDTADSAEASFSRADAEKITAGTVRTNVPFEAPGNRDPISTRKTQERWPSTMSRIERRSAQTETSSGSTLAIQMRPARASPAARRAFLTLPTSLSTSATALGDRRRTPQSRRRGYSARRVMHCWTVCITRPLTWGWRSAPLKRSRTFTPPSPGSWPTGSCSSARAAPDRPSAPRPPWRRTA